MANSQSSIDQLIAILKQVKVAKRLKAEYAAVLEEGGCDEDRDRWASTLTCDLEKHIKPALFEELIISQLPRPSIINCRDLADAFLHHLVRGADDDFAARYAHFIRATVGSVFEERSSEPIEVLRFETFKWFDLRALKEPLLWQARDDFALSFNGVLIHSRPFDLTDEHDSFHDHIAYVTLVGYCTQRALDAAISELKQALPALLKSFQLLADARGESSYREHTETEQTVEEILEAYESMDLSVPGNSSDDQPTPAAPQEDAFDEPWGGMTFLPQLRAQLDAYFSSPTKKEAMAKRIHNAARLLVEADRQSTHAIGLALSVSAIEAVLGEKGSEISRTMAENVANLFEPELRERSNAIEFVKRLYASRSDVLHGNESTSSEQERRDARLLAAAVMKAIVDRQMFLSRCGGRDVEKPSDLFKELEKHRYVEGPFLGVPSAPINYLWRKKPPYLL